MDDRPDPRQDTMTEQHPEQPPAVPEPTALETVARLAAEAAVRAIPDPFARLELAEQGLAEIRQILAAAAGPDGGSARLSARLELVEQILASPAPDPAPARLEARLELVEQALGAARRRRAGHARRAAAAARRPAPQGRNPRKENPIMPIVNGTLTDFGLDPLTVNSPVLYFRASSTGIAGLNILSKRKAVEVRPAAGNGFFEVDLVATAAVAPADTHYIIELRYRDEAGMTISETLPWKLYVPGDGGALGDLLRVPANPALVFTGTEPPELATAGVWWLDAATGDLAEFDGTGWQHKTNLRGPAGYNATGAAEDDAAVAAFINGATATRTALDTRYARYSAAAAANTAALAVTAAPRWTGI